MSFPKRDIYGSNNFVDNDNPFSKKKNFIEVTFWVSSP